MAGGAVIVKGMTAPQTHTSTILLVENEAVIRLMLKEALGRERYRVMEVGDGNEATDTFRADRDVIDLVLLDLNMPEKDGLEVLEELISVNETVKVIIVSAYAPPEKSLGYTAFVPKPCQLRQLLGKASAFWRESCQRSIWSSATSSR